MRAHPPITSSSKNPPSPDTYPVLVVEDDRQVAKLVKATLTSAGYVPKLYSTAEELLEKVANIESPILVTDVWLAGLTGLELVERLAEMRDDFEVVAITAHADVETLAHAMELGIFRCLTKPFAGEDLRLAVAGAANRLFLRLDRRIQIETLSRQNTELATALEQLRASESRRVLSERLASIGRFAASLAHEINNPLAYVQTNLALLSDATPDLVKAVEALTKGSTWAELDPEISGSAARFVFELPAVLEECTTGLSLMRQISTDLGSVARYRTEAAEVFDFNDVVRTACRVARVEPRLRAHFELDLSAETLHVRGSTGRLAQVVMNLVANASEATDKRSQRPNEITVRTRLEDEYAVLEVNDTGIGLSPEQKRLIFEPFVTFREGGAGIGLGLVREIVGECGGSIEVKSELGVGSTFRVSLPRANVAARAKRRERERLPKNVEILVVEDDPLVRNALARAFRAQRVRFAENGAIALREIVHKRPDLVISDLQMPEMDGVTLYESISSRWPALAKRMLFVTGTEELIDAARNRAPICPLVRKPFQVRELEARLLELLR